MGQQKRKGASLLLPLLSTAADQLLRNRVRKLPLPSFPLPAPLPPLPVALSVTDLPAS